MIHADEAPKTLCPTCEREMENDADFIRQHKKYCERVHSRSLVQLPIDEQLDEIDQILQTVLETLPLNKKDSPRYTEPMVRRVINQNLRRTASTSTMVEINPTFTSLLLLQQIAAR